MDDSEMVDGMVFDHKAAKSAGGPTRIENAKIGLVQFQISPPKTDLENNVIISDYQQMDRILKEERNYILQMIKKIRATGCNVLLIQKSILRDAVTELSLHYLVSTKLAVLRQASFLRLMQCLYDTITAFILKALPLHQMPSLRSRSVVRVQ